MFLFLQRTISGQLLRPQGEWSQRIHTWARIEWPKDKQEIWPQRSFSLPPSVMCSSWVGTFHISWGGGGGLWSLLCCWTAGDGIYGWGCTKVTRETPSAPIRMKNILCILTSISGSSVRDTVVSISPRRVPELQRRLVREAVASRQVATCALLPFLHGSYCHYSALVWTSGKKKLLTKWVATLFSISGYGGVGWQNVINTVMGCFRSKVPWICLHTGNYCPRGEIVIEAKVTSHTGFGDIQKKSAILRLLSSAQNTNRAWTHLQSIPCPWTVIQRETETGRCSEKDTGDMFSLWCSFLPELTGVEWIVRMKVWMGGNGKKWSTQEQKSQHEKNMRLLQMHCFQKACVKTWDQPFVFRNRQMFGLNFSTSISIGDVYLRFCNGTNVQFMWNRENTRTEHSPNEIVNLVSESSARCMLVSQVLHCVCVRQRRCSRNMGSLSEHVSYLHHWEIMNMAWSILCTSRNGFFLGDAVQFD